MYQTYFKAVQEQFQDHDESTEHTFRTALENLLNEFKKKKTKRFVNIIHEPANQRGKGRPDFKVTTQEQLTLGFIETKKIGEDLDKILNSKQLDKYKQLSDNIIVTDYLRFILIRKGEPILETTLFSKLQLKKKRFKIDDSRIAELHSLLKNFFESDPEPVYKVKDLAVKLSNKAIYLKDFCRDILDEEEGTQLHGLMNAFQDILLPSIDSKKFSDIYAQTLTYGLFLAALNCNDPNKELNKRTAYDLLPKTFPLIKELFHQLENFPDDVIWAIDEIISILKITDFAAIQKEFSDYRQKGKGFTDPYIYFYEDFLFHFDKKQRKIRGVYYTPEPVVSFIVRSIEQILKDKFDIKDGFLGENVTVLDFACGTGTFLLNVFVKAIEQALTIGDKETIKKLVNEKMLNNFYGFELLVAPYIISHLKISEYLKEQGFPIENNNRLKIYLTNTLTNKEPKPFAFMPSLSEEGKKANKIKNQDVLVILGNPPYSVSSSNKTGFIAEQQMQKYKTAVKSEKNIQPLSDDYIKFIRFAHWKMENVDRGVIGIITNNSFIDGLIHRGMREELLKDFDEIYILNLHGNSRIKETCPDGSKDENVFDIMQGVCISLFVKTSNNVKKAKVYYEDLWGKRKNKYDSLINYDLFKLSIKNISVPKKYYFFNNRNINKLEFYEKAMSLTEIFDIYTSGIKTHDDKNLISFDKFHKKNQKYHYRPFDIRNIHYDTQKVVRHRYNVMKYMLKDNIAISTKRNHYEGQNNLLIIDCLTDIRLTSCPGTNGSDYVFPLYLFNIPDDTPNGIIKEPALPYAGFDEPARKPNFTKEFTEYIKSRYKKQPKPEQILGYIYAVLHSPAYRTKYIEFLKIDFPRVPFTEDEELFYKLSEAGWELIQHHLMKKSYDNNICKMHGSGENFKVELVKYEKGKININKDRYFEPVPENIWNFYIGGYQVLEKWLKERKKHGITLSAKDIQHFIKVVNILDYTINAMDEIDGMCEGWV